MSTKTTTIFSHPSSNFRFFCRLLNDAGFSLMDFQSYKSGSSQGDRGQNGWRWRPSNIGIPVLPLRSPGGKQTFYFYLFLFLFLFLSYFVLIDGFRGIPRSWTASTEDLSLQRVLANRKRKVSNIKSLFDCHRGSTWEYVRQFRGVSPIFGRDFTSNHLCDEFDVGCPANGAQVESAPPCRMLLFLIANMS